jgi:N-acetyltransferase
LRLIYHRRMSFDLQPNLQGELVKLRPLLPADLEPLFALASDPLIWELHPASDRYQRPVFEAYFESGLASGGAFLISDLRTGQTIGSSRYADYSESESVVEIGWTFLIREYWGGQVNRDLKRVMLKHAFQFVDRVIFKVGRENWRSQRAMTKIGGKITDTIVDANGLASVVFTITRDEFEKGPLSK